MTRNDRNTLSCVSRLLDAPGSASLPRLRRMADEMTAGFSNVLLHLFLDGMEDWNSRTLPACSSGRRAQSAAEESGISACLPAGLASLCGRLAAADEEETRRLLLAHAPFFADLENREAVRDNPFRFPLQAVLDVLERVWPPLLHGHALRDAETAAQAEKTSLIKAAS